MSGSESDDDDDVVVMRVCASRHCQGIADLEYDEETNASYCGRCRALFARTKTEGFRILLGSDDCALVQLIFSRFDTAKRGYWTYVEWGEFAAHTDHAAASSSAAAVDSDVALRDHFAEEYDIALRTCGSDGYVVRCDDLENMYGGYLYNNIDALVEDSDALEEAGLLNTAMLE